MAGEYKHLGRGDQGLGSGIFYVKLQDRVDSKAVGRRAGFKDKVNWNLLLV